MKNKTIRVWNEEITSCTECLMWDAEYNRCNPGRFEINTSLGLVDNRCPFSKSLSKEQIESCGYKYYSHDGTGKNYRKPWSKNNFFIYNVHIDDSFSCIEISLVDDDTYFIGHINNLPEFKLILKMLNIE